MKVLHVIDSLGIGGAEKLLVGIINGLAGHEHHLLYLSSPDTLKNELPSSCKVSKLGFSSKGDISRCVCKVRKYIRDHNIEIVHSHLVMSTLIVRLAAPGNVQVYNSLHSAVGARFFGKGKVIQRWVEKLSYKKRHFVIAVSEQVLNDYKQYIGIKGPCAVLPNFVGDDFFVRRLKKMAQDGAFRMITVGSLKPQKNYDFLLRAFPDLPANVSLDIYGDGPLKEEIAKKIEAGKLNIRLCGVSNNVSELFPQYDLFVMASTVEGHPIALLEAMASGMPVMVSHIPALIEATEGCAIYFQLDSTSEFTRNVKAMADHEIDLDQLAIKSHEIAKKKGGKAGFIEKLTAIYQFRLQ